MAKKRSKKSLPGKRPLNKTQPAKEQAGGAPIPSVLPGSVGAQEAKALPPGRSSQVEPVGQGPTDKAEPISPESFRAGPVRWTKPKDYLVASARALDFDSKSADQSQADYLQASASHGYASDNQSVDRTQLDTLLEEVERARSENDGSIAERAAAQYLANRRGANTAEAGGIQPAYDPTKNGLFEFVADRQSGGTKQTAGENPNSQATKWLNANGRSGVQQSGDLPTVETGETTDATGGRAWTAADEVLAFSLESDRPESTESGTNWLPTGILADPKQIAAMPLSQRSALFIENLRESIVESAGNGAQTKQAETKGLTEKKDEQKLSGEWRPAESGSDDGSASSDKRPVLPPAAMRKKKQPVELPKVSLEERLVNENIVAHEFQEEQGIALQRLKDKTTTGGQYHIYLAIYAIAVVLAFLTQRALQPDMLKAANSAGKTVTSAVSRLMPPKAMATFANGLHYYEDEATKASPKKAGNVVGAVVGGIGGGVVAAIRVATSDPVGAPSANRLSWFQLPTGFFLGFPAAALYTVRQLYENAVIDRSALEMLLTGLMYFSLVATSSIVYMKLRRRLALGPLILAPIVVGVLVSVTSMITYAVMIFSASICQRPMPDTIQLFTAIAVITISVIASKLAFHKRKMPVNDGHML